MSDCHVLLRPPALEEAARYHEQLLAKCEPALPVEVRLDAGDGKGKGVFATRDIRQGELVFEERALAGVQHAENKADMPACPHCFKAIVSPEQCVAGLLCAAIGRLSGGTEGEDDGGDDESGPLDPEEAARRVQLIEAAVDAPMLEGLISGTRRLPRSELLDVPGPVACVGGCEERYCSTECAQAAWEQYHCLLCPVGEPSTGGETSGSGSSSDAKGKGKARAVDPAPRTGRSCHRARAGGGVSGSSSGGSKGKKQRPEAEDVVCGVRLRRGRLPAFLEHADDSNDMFRLAAQVLAITLVAAHRELQALQQRSNGGQSSSGEKGAEGPLAAEDKAVAGGSGLPDELRTEALRRAWLPFAVAQKAPWWQVVSVEDEDDEEEEEFRQQIREMSSESLKLLRAAWVETPWPELMDLEVYGSVVGMFEQNNLALNIPSPAKCYFGLAHDEDALPDAPERAALEQQLEPLRLALGDDLATSIEGTAFYSLQSCCNHSCAPAAAAAGDPAGSVRVSAARDIAAGEEVTISYIEEEGVGLEERRAALADYGFVCQCERCEADELAARLDASTVGA